MTIRSWKFKLICAVLLLSAASSKTFAQDGASQEAQSSGVEAVADEGGADSSADSDGAASDASPSKDDSASDDSGEGSDSVEGTPPVDGATYRVRLRDLEQRVDELKEQIRRSHTRLSLLSDTILSGASGGGRAEIEFVNDLSGAWHVVEAIFVLDGAVQYKKTDDTGVLAKQRNIPIFSGSVPTGDHTLQVMLKLRGHGFGVFSYLRGIEAEVTSSHSFTLTDGKVLELKATAWEQGGPTTPVEEQPAIRFQQTIRSASDVRRNKPIESTSGKKASLPTGKSSAQGDPKKNISAGASVGGDSSEK